tara:strand:+ start:1445 stop:1627 length:183 start_codon:yes stop_codon:yes gene_type:complete
MEKNITLTDDSFDIFLRYCVEQFCYSKWDLINIVRNPSHFQTEWNMWMADSMDTKEYSDD